MPLTENNVKCELSYAMLHAVAASAGYACEAAPRHTDDLGIDARIVVKDAFGADSTLTEFKLEIQLKATSQQLTLNNGAYSYSLKIEHYDKLRTTRVDAPRYLVVLMLPENRTEWLSKTADQLICKRCLRWVSLRNAQEVTQATTTVYIPEDNVLTPDSLKHLARIRSKEEWIDYDNG